MRKTILQHKFVEFIPESLDRNTLYLSTEYTTAVHSCCCGCGNEVVTPLSPTDWCMTFDGASISLQPSIGNWSLPCKSHYVIKKNQILWAGKWTDTEIKTGRNRDQQAKKDYFSKDLQPIQTIISLDLQKTFSPNLESCVSRKPSILAKLYKLFK